MQNATTWAQQTFTSRTDPYVFELFTQHQALEWDSNGVISKFAKLQAKYQNDNFLADLQTYNGKGDISFKD